MAHCGLSRQKRTIIAFMMVIYNYTPETNQVCRLYSVAAVLDGTLSVISYVEYPVL